MKDLSGIGQVAEIQIDNNRTLRYLKAGKGNPLILLHTIRTQLDYFQEVIPTLAKYYTVYALDLPGHGYSSIDTKASYDEPYFRKAVGAFIEQLDLQKITLVGESIGAVLALTVASMMPERVVKVVASNTYDYDTRYADGVRRGNFFANFVIGNYAIPIHGAIFAALENWLFLGIALRGGLRNKSWMPNALLTELNRAGRRKGYRYVERNVFTHWKSWGKARALYSGVRAPVKLIYGDHDWSTMLERQRTAKELGGINVVTIENTGHFGFVDNPQKMIEIVLDS
ncbi:tropinesterase [mine drainage metagenome]|uniref:Tropinesterase n=1 Tax=mine drainage metagenome TaxID=410659 RepID=A0A1J5S3W7_9ZZZZ